MRSFVTAAALAAVVGLSPAAEGHVQPVPIEQWGAFSPAALGCLRLVSRATHACFDSALGALAKCNDASLAGGACDWQETDARIAAASRAARLTLTSACEQPALMELGYRDVFDASADLFNACVTQARGAASASYAPALAARPSLAAAACMTGTAAYARRAIRLALQRGRRAMERFAAHRFSAAEKTALVARNEAEIGSLRQRWVADLLDICPEFAAVYGRSADSFARTVKQRADCVLQNTYIHSLIACPSQICGNGITEGNEECDDGNRHDTDTCRTDCTAGPQ